MSASIQREFRTHVLAPTLRRIGLWSAAAERLLFGTAMHESAGLGYLSQWPAGPALGIYQMERATFDDLWANWLDMDRADRARWLESAKIAQDARAAVNLLSPVYATIAARLQFWRDPAPLPDADDARALGVYYKRVWNGPGKATEQDFIDALARWEAA